jgi:hypothetical protein
VSAALRSLITQVRTQQERGLALARSRGFTWNFGGELLIRFCETAQVEDADGELAPAMGRLVAEYHDSELRFVAPEGL